MQRSTQSHWVARLIPPRPTFDADMSEDERALTGRHAAYWTQVAAEPGRVVVYGPVHDASGAWGLVVFAADDGVHAQRILDADPAVAEGLMRPQLGPMAVTVRAD